MSRGRRRGTRSGDGVEDTFSRAVRAAGDTVEFRVETSTQLATLELVTSSARRWLIVIAVLLALNWAHDLGVAVEVFDWWDGREAEGGFLSSEIEHEITILMPLLLALVPIWWGRRRDKQAKIEHAVSETRAQQEGEA